MKTKQMIKAHDVAHDVAADMTALLEAGETVRFSMPVSKTKYPYLYYKGAKVGCFPGHGIDAESVMLAEFIYYITPHAKATRGMGLGVLVETLKEKSGLILKREYVGATEFVYSLKKA